MLRSEEPCEIAITLIRFCPTAWKMPAASPGVPRMPLPTTATIEISRMPLISLMYSRSSSVLNSLRNACKTCAAALSGTTQQMLCSLLLWLIILTIDDRAGEQMAAAVKTNIATNGGVANQLTDTASHVTRSAWELSFIYGPLMTFAAVAIVLVVVMKVTTK